MANPRQKDTNKTNELVVKPKRIYHHVEPIRFKLRKVKIIDLGEGLKRIYRIKN